MLFEEPQGIRRMVWPYAVMRKPIPESAPAEIVQDYVEAVQILTISPRASATLARRCLQAMLTTNGYPGKRLVDQIKAVVPDLPKYLSENVDYIRHAGNLGAHPEYDHGGEIVDVEHGEADWVLEMIEQLLEHFYARPAEARARRDAWAAKFNKK